MADTSSIDWTSLIQTGVELTKTGIGAASASATNCGKECRAKCKEETGTFFSGRSKCKKACKADCLRRANEPATPPPNPLSLIIISIIVIALIGGILYWIFKKK